MNVKLKDILFLFISCHILPSFSYPLCQDGFYNSRTRKCESCANLCNLPADESLCNANCPGFLEKTTNCNRGFYFDRHVGIRGKCEPCSVLCYRHETTRNTQNCKSKCPDEYASQEGLTNQSTGVSVQDNVSDDGQTSKQEKKPGSSNKAVAPPKENKTDGHTDGTIIAITSLLLVAVIGAIVIGVIVDKFYKNQETRKTRPVMDEEVIAPKEKLHGGKPVQESKTKDEEGATEKLISSDDTGVKMAFPEVCQTYRCSVSQN